MSDGNYKFGTTVNCMDGRSLEATVGWMKKEYGLDYVDDITEPGMDGLICKMNDNEREHLRRMLEISITKHGSRVVTVVGHDDCAGNPVSSEQHHSDIASDVAKIRDIASQIDPSISVDVIGLWAHPDADKRHWTVEKI